VCVQTTLQLLKGLPDKETEVRVTMTLLWTVSSRRVLPAAHHHRMRSERVDDAQRPCVQLIRYMDFSERGTEAAMTLFRRVKDLGTRWPCAAPLCAAVLVTKCDVTIVVSLATSSSLTSLLRRVCRVRPPVQVCQCVVDGGGDPRRSLREVACTARRCPGAGVVNASTLYSNVWYVPLRLVRMAHCRYGRFTAPILLSDAISFTSARLPSMA
jgi:hypothetical protein